MGRKYVFTLQDLPSSLVGKLTYLSASIEHTMAPMYADPAVMNSCCGICGGSWCNRSREFQISFNVQRAGLAAEDGRPVEAPLGLDVGGGGARCSRTQRQKYIVDDGCRYLKSESERTLAGIFEESTPQSGQQRNVTQKG